jgi:hypothetical protein
MRINKWNEAIKLEVGIYGHPDVRFEVLVHLVSKKKKLPGRKAEGHPFTMMYYHFKKEYRIVYVARLDSFSGD